MVSMGRGIISLPRDNVKKRTTGLFHFVALAFLLAGCEQPNQGDAPEFSSHHVFLNGGVYTINGAYIHDQDDLLGSIEVEVLSDKMSGIVGTRLGWSSGSVVPWFRCRASVRQRTTGLGEPPLDIGHSLFPVGHSSSLAGIPACSG